MLRRLDGAWQCGGAILRFDPSIPFVRVSATSQGEFYWRKLRLYSTGTHGWLCRVGNETVNFRLSAEDALTVAVTWKEDVPSKAVACWGSPIT
jgi:hypothetical protein